MKWCLDSPVEGFLHPHGTSLETTLTGWAFDEADPVQKIQVKIDGKTVDVLRFNFERPDVHQAHGLPARLRHPVGFRHSLQLSEHAAPGEHQLSVEALHASQQVSTLGEVNFSSRSVEHFTEIGDRFKCLPAYLVLKVNGFLDEETFWDIGKGVAEVLIAEASTPNQPTQVLDFGCGLGRILLPVSKAFPDAKFTAFDIDREMLDWGQFLVKDYEHHFTGDVSLLPDESFDFLYAISVFTHLDTSTEAVLQEMKRLLKPGGRAFLSYHDETLFTQLAGSPSLPGVPKGTPLDEKHVTGEHTPEGEATKGIFYQTSYWESILSKQFQVLKTQQRSLYGFQSHSMVKKSG